MIGTVEALGVFLLAILPGFVGLRVYHYGRPPLRARGALGELGATTIVSFVGWTGLFLWRGEDLLPTVLEGGKGTVVSERLDAFAELVALSIAIGCALGVAGRIVVASAGAFVRANPQGDDVADASRKWRGAAAGALQKRILPANAWDRLLARLSNLDKAVVCRVTRTDGTDVFGAMANEGYLDWEADGRDLLLKPELVPDGTGRLRPIEGSLGVFVPGEEVSTLSVVSYPDEQLELGGDD